MGESDQKPSNLPSPLPCEESLSTSTSVPKKKKLPKKPAQTKPGPSAAKPKRVTKAQPAKAPAKKPPMKELQTRRRPGTSPGMRKIEGRVGDRAGEDEPRGPEEARGRTSEPPQGEGLSAGSKTSHSDTLIAGMGPEGGGAALSLLQRASLLTLQTGNLLNWGRLKKKCQPGHSEELWDCIRTTLNEWKLKISPEQLQESPTLLEYSVAQATETINPEEREEMKVSAKLFITGSDFSSIREAVDLACSALGVTQLDSVIIAPPPTDDEVTLSLEHLQPYWEELERLVKKKKIVAIGTSDLDKALLEQLYQWAQVKPNSNQVNLASCCVMPPDLTEFAKQCDIQLLTHNDPKELLSELSFQEAIQDTIEDSQSKEWTPLWLLRYSVIVKSRGIIKSKGYILQAKKKVSL